MKIKNLFALSVILVLCTRGYAGQSSFDSYIGKKWSELPDTKYGGVNQPLDWKGSRKLSIRYFEPEFSKEVVTLVENKYLKDRSQDVILAVLDLREFTYDKGNNLVVGTIDCKLKENPEKDSVVIGLIKQDRKKIAIKYKPIRAWLIESSTMKFQEVPASLVSCELTNQAG